MLDEPTFRIAYRDSHGIARSFETGDWPWTALSLRFDDSPIPSRDRRLARRRRELVLTLLGAGRKPMTDAGQLPPVPKEYEGKSAHEIVDSLTARIR